MNRNTLAIKIVLIISLLSCDRREEPKMEPTEELAMFAGRFCMLDHASFDTDSNSFIFSKAGRWQRSYIIVVSKVDEKRRRLMFQEIDWEGGKDQPSHDIHFKGHSFDLNDDAWNEVIERSKGLCTEANRKVDYRNVLDVNSYIVAHNGIVCGVNSGERTEEYERFSEFILRLADSVGGLSKE